MNTLSICVTHEQFCFQKNFSCDSTTAAEQLILDQESKEKTGKTNKGFLSIFLYSFVFVSSVQYSPYFFGLDLTECLSSYFNPSLMF